jgi:hypothetical protein
MKRRPNLMLELFAIPPVDTKPACAAAFNWSAAQAPCLYWLGPPDDGDWLADALDEAIWSVSRGEVRADLQRRGLRGVTLQPSDFDEGGALAIVLQPDVNWQVSVSGGHSATGEWWMQYRLDLRATELDDLEVPEEVGHDLMRTVAAVGEHIPIGHGWANITAEGGADPREVINAYFHDLRDERGEWEWIVGYTYLVVVPPAALSRIDDSAAPAILAERIELTGASAGAVAYRAAMPPAKMAHNDLVAWRSFFAAALAPDRDNPHRPMFLQRPLPAGLLPIDWQPLDPAGHTNDNSW